MRAEFTEVADRVWVARYEWFDVNVTLVGGEPACSSSTPTARPRAAREVVDDVRRLGAGDGDRRSSTPTSTSTTPSATAPSARRTARCRSTPTRTPATSCESRGRARSRSGTPTTPTTRDRDEVLGDRDRAARTRRSPRPGCSTSATARSSWSTPAAATPPATWWSACPTPTSARRRPGRGVRRRRTSATTRWPMDWPLTLDLVLGLTDARHASWSRATARRSTGSSSRSSATPIGIVAETIRDLAARGVPVDRGARGRRVAVARASTSPTAVRRGYEHLPRSQKRLPLI